MIHEIIHPRVEVREERRLMNRTLRATVMKAFLWPGEYMWDSRAYFSGNEDPKQQQQPSSLPPFNPRIILTIFLISMILTFFTSSREGQRGGNGGTDGYISWNEFVQNMLSKGEVNRSIRSLCFVDSSPLVQTLLGARSDYSYWRRSGLHQTAPPTGGERTKSESILPWSLVKPCSLAVWSRYLCDEN